ncbi:MAG: sulfatase-like hydrolase/transferase [Myxococcota bacterium]
MLRAVGAAGVTGCSAAGPPRDRDGPPVPAGPRNIVYIYADQHRAPVMGALGDPVVLTPNLDALAAESVRFPWMFTNAPLCRPARASMMTGRLAHVHGCWDNDSLADPLGPSHVRRIRDEAGYRTALIGKSHLTLIQGHSLAEVNVEKMRQWGFEDSLELLSQITCATKPNPYSDWLGETTPAGERSKAERYAAYVTAWELLGFPPPDVDPYDLGTADHVDLWCGDLAAAWIRDQAAGDDDRPFYLQVNFPGPHPPYDATREFRDRYDPTDPAFPTAILGPPGTPRSPAVEYLWQSRPELHGLTGADSRALIRDYYAKVTLVDEAVGAVLAALAEAGRLDDTWVVYGADHGDLLGDHELWGKVAMYEGGVRTPLLVRPPGGVAGWAAEGVVDQLDVTATILGLAGLDSDGAGDSRVEQLLGGPDAPGAQDGKESVIALVAATQQGTLRTGMLRRGALKLVYDFDSARPVELYDLQADPEERSNRVLDPSLQATVADLRDELLDTLDAQKSAAEG